MAAGETAGEGRQRLRGGRIMSADMSRRAVIHAAAWSMPVIAVAVAVPLAAASEAPKPPLLVCKPRSVHGGDVEAVTFDGNIMAIKFRPNARNWVDVTIRQQGLAEIHINLGAPGQPTNNQPRMGNYVPGEVYTIALSRPFDINCDWFQVQGIHPNNCEVVS